MTAITAPASISAAATTSSDECSQPPPADVAGDGRQREEARAARRRGRCRRGCRCSCVTAGDRDAADDRRDDAVEGDRPVDDRCPAGSPGRSTAPRPRPACRARSPSRRSWVVPSDRSSPVAAAATAAVASSGVSAATVRRSRSWTLARNSSVSPRPSTWIVQLGRIEPWRSGSSCPGVSVTALATRVVVSGDSASRRPGRCPTAARSASGCTITLITAQLDSTRL